MSKHSNFRQFGASESVPLIILLFFLLFSTPYLFLLSYNSFKSRIAFFNAFLRLKNRMNVFHLENAYIHPGNAYNKEKSLYQIELFLKKKLQRLLDATRHNATIFLASKHSCRQMINNDNFFCST